ncbi:MULTISPECIES: IclR family transcriptional regulator [unclassified Cryobacterium]|uniref:IclR family transcriptional regulator n=1 Tax=unclassified Cryobacterium TaxID=2649013 RepID=UPI002AB5C4DA|nr:MULTISPECIES: IclR family transcriptional regulator [unclassified Cryobacterium]MDY7542227.1 IclR family transcriptional regulator [Cryobacterium sp. 5B3]MEB0265024.1 IclR family transcriptional regulator [Cryobacterium sp. 10I5]MEB0275078.1 IclR family transcriptional regulator [Cryobacterium sp. 5B3]
MSVIEVEKGAQAPAVLKAVRILDLLALSPGRARSLSDIARELGIAKSSTSNLCASLEEGGLIRRSGGGYLLGRRAVELGSAYLAGFDQIREFYRICEESEVLTTQLVQIAMLDGARVLYLAAYEGRERFPLSAGVGDRYPSSATAVGTVLLAELPPDEVEALYADPNRLVTFTDRSTKDLETLQRKLKMTRERGYAIDEGEIHLSVVGLAVLVPSTRSGEPSFGIGASLVHPNDSPEERARVLAALRVAAAELTRPTIVPVEK